MNGSRAQAKGQDAAHRRGLVLGLTMAEVMVLILFLLLLALALRESKLKETLKDKTDKLASLTLLEERFAEVLNKNPEGLTVDSIVQEIRREQDKTRTLEKELTRLKPYEDVGQALESIIQEIKRSEGKTPTPQQVMDRIKGVSSLSKENETLRGQNAQLSRQIKASGRGNEFPSCWVTPDGYVESIFEVLIFADGITIKERYLPHRTHEKAELPIAGLRYGQILSHGEFVEQLRPLYLWSVKHDCRFYVITASSDQTAPIGLVNAVNGFFYPYGRIQYWPQHE